MKKALPALAAVLAIAAGGAGFYLTQHPGGLQMGGKLAAADYLPSETLLLLALPDPGKSFENWKTTDLYKIWAEPQVQAFLAKPLSKIPANPGLDATWPQIAALEPKSLFVALTALDEKDNRPHLLGGFQFKGTKDDVERVLATPKKQLRDGNPAGKADLVNYQGHSIETFDDGHGSTLAAVYVGDWYLLSNDPALLKSTLDRVDRRAPENQPPLSKEADFQSVGAKLPSGCETLIFGRAQPFLTRLYALAAASGQAVEPERRAESEKIKAVGLTTRIENGKIRDTIYTLAPGLKQDNAHLQMTSLPLSSPNTLFYLASVIDWSGKSQLPAADAGVPASMREFFASLAARGITMDAVRAAFGTEAGLQLDWPSSNMQPSLLASIEVRDPAAAKKLVDQATAAPLGTLPWQTAQANGRTFYSVDVPNLTMYQPTLTLADKHLIVGLDAAQVREAAEREGSAAPTFTASESYKAAYALVDKPNTAFAYLDAKSLFEKTYGLLRPYAMLGAAFLPPQNAEYIDLGKLPDTETISRHLSPSVFSQTLDTNGIKLESVGSVTFAQEAVGLLGVSSALAYATFEKDAIPRALSNLQSPGAAPTPAAAETPAPDASPSPAASPKTDGAEANHP